VARIDLVLPGLIPPSGMDQELRWPLLERLLARARQQPLRSPGSDSQLLELFHHPNPAACAVAAYTRQADLPAATGSCWMRADPVSLRADLTDIILFDGKTFSLEAAQADRLLTDLNTFYADEPWELLRGADPTRWYLRLPEQPRIETTPLVQVHGRPISASLPSGPAAVEWRRIANDIQMFLHQHPLNQTREAQGLPPINGLWLWGNGPQASVSADYCRVYADDPLSKGLAQCAGLEHLDLEAFDSSTMPGGDAPVLWVSLTLQEALYSRDPACWREALDGLMAAYLGEIMQAWRSGRIDTLNLYTGAWRFMAGRYSRWRIWRRDRTLSSYA